MWIRSTNKRYSVNLTGDQIKGEACPVCGSMPGEPCWGGMVTSHTTRALQAASRYYEGRGIKGLTFEIM